MIVPTQEAAVGRQVTARTRPTPTGTIPRHVHVIGVEVRQLATYESSFRHAQLIWLTLSLLALAATSRKAWARGYAAADDRLL